MRNPALLVLLAAAPLALSAQDKVMESPAASISQNLGLTRVELTYHRPAVKGRTLWGGLVPYGQVWRTGANEATTLSFSTPVQVAGHPVPAGTYALFAIPGQEKWTFILNRTAKQWGAFKYDPTQDQLRFDATPTAAPMAEWLTYTLDLSDQRTATLTLHWGQLAVGFPITAEIKDFEALKAKWRQ